MTKCPKCGQVLRRKISPIYLLSIALLVILWYFSKKSLAVHIVFCVLAIFIVIRFLTSPFVLDENNTNDDSKTGDD